VYPDLISAVSDSPLNPGAAFELQHADILLQKLSSSIDSL
jgi:hypothetical protein